MARARIPTRTRDHARLLRREQTQPERLLWGRLRDHRLNGLGFPRQAPLGPYVADFVCHEARVVIELDGDQHGEEAHRRRDMRRDAWFAGNGYLVLRFWNHEVVRTLDAVVETICAHTLPRTPPSLASSSPTGLAALGSAHDKGGPAPAAGETR